MFSRKKKRPPAKTSKGRGGHMEFSIPGIPGFDPTIQDDDEDLEAELLALTGGRKKKTADIDIDCGDDDDDDLEAELARILGNTSRKKKAAPIKTVPLVQSAYIDPLADIDDEANSDNEFDENDPALLQELTMLTAEDEDEAVEEADEEDGSEEEEVVPSQYETIRIRLGLYKDAENKAKASNESARARRFNRGVKTLEKLLKRAETGEVIPNDEIPPHISLPAPQTAPAKPPVTVDDKTENPELEVPEVPSNDPLLDVTKFTNETYPSNANESDSTPSVGPSEIPSVPNPILSMHSISDDPDPSKENENNVCLPSVPVKPTPEIPPEILPVKQPVVITNPIFDLLLARSMEYKKAALGAKKVGNKAAALDYVRAVKSIEQLMNLAKNGERVSEAQIPPPLTSARASSSVGKANPPPPPIERQRLAWMNTEIFTVPKTVVEALTQRLNYYTKALKTAEMKGFRADATWCRVVVKAYQTALEQHKRGAYVPFEKLPAPPGCPPIPIAFQI